MNRRSNRDFASKIQEDEDRMLAMSLMAGVGSGGRFMGMSHVFRLFFFRF